ncbi:MAG: 30S ribosomal protein S16 [Candidatus Promineifilaceae bacterium]
MLRIRLARRGKKRHPSYRVVVADIKSKRDGRYVEQVGFYDPMTDPITFKMNEERSLYWLSVGAQPSDAVARLLNKQGTMDRLARLRAGEELGKLAAEFNGTPWPPVVEEAVVEEAVVEAVEEVVEEAEAVVEEAADAE